MSDYIDRQAAIKDVYAIHTVDTEYDAALIDRLDVRYVLEDLPSADVEPVKHGRWEYRNFGGWHCSLCDEQAPFWCMASTQNLSKYCPNCGVRMDGEADG